MQQVRLISMASLLAMLVWVVADYSLTETASLHVRIYPISDGGSDMRAAAVGDTDGPFSVQVTGRKAALAGLKSREPIVVRLPISRRDSGRYTLQLIELLRIHAEALADVIIQDVAPPDMEVEVDREMTVTMPVQVLPGSLKYEGPVVVEPAKVGVTMWESDYKGLDAADQVVVVDPDEYLRTAVRGEAGSDNVPLTPIVGDVPVQLDPGYVTIRYKLALQLEEETISAVPIKIESSLDIFNEYNVEVKDAAAILTRPISIRGPTEEIGRIRAGEVRIVGVISLTAADKVDPVQFRYQTPRFNLPEGVTLVGQAEPIEYRLVPRGANP